MGQQKTYRHFEMKKRTRKEQTFHAPIPMAESVFDELRVQLVEDRAKKGELLGRRDLYGRWGHHGGEVSVRGLVVVRARVVHFMDNHPVHLREGTL